MPASKRRRKDKNVLSEDQLKILVEEMGGDMTLQEIGNLYGITRMRICQIEKLSLQKLAEIASLKDAT